MTTEEYEIHRIETTNLSLLKDGQIGVETINDLDLEYKMYGGKDGDGIVQRWLSKGNPGLLTTLKLTGPTTIDDTGFLKHDSSGNITGNHDVATGIRAYGATNWLTNNVEIKSESDQISISQDEINNRILITWEAEFDIVDLQTAYNNGSHITISEAQGPVFIISPLDSVDSCLAISNLEEENGADLVNLYQVANAYQIYMSGAEGFAWGNEIGAAELMSLRVTGSGYDDSVFNSYSRFEIYESEGEKIAESSLIADNDDLSYAARVAAEAHYSEGVQYSKVEIEANRVDITAFGNNLYLGAFNHKIDCGYTPLMNVKAMGFGAEPYDNGTISSGSMTYDTKERSYQKVIISADTAVTLVDPLEVGSYFLKINASGATRTLTGFGDVIFVSTLRPNIVPVTIDTDQNCFVILYYFGSDGYFGLCHRV